MSALTRIRNNQVYNSDINAQYKITTKTITGGLLADNFTYTGNMTIGNLTVNGQTTTVDTTNLVIADPLLAINRNQSGSPSYDLGFVMGRGNQTNVAMIWEEQAQQFQLQYTTESTAATTFGTINNSGYANLQAYGVSLNNATIGTASLTTLNTGTITATGNIWADSGTASTNKTTGALVVTGGAGISGALNVGSGLNLLGNGYITTDQSTANLLGTATTISAFASGTVITIGSTSGAVLVINPTTVRGASSTTTLYNTLATTMNFAGAATALNMGATSGTANIANPTLVGSQSTQNLYNTVATTMNFAGAATSLVMGAATGAATINNPVLALPNGTQLLINGANPTIDTSATGTVSLFNANATTLNIGGAATVVSIGASTGRTTINNDAAANNLYATGGGQHIGYHTGAIGANVPNSGVFTTATVNGTLYAASVNAGTIGNSGATFTGASGTLTGNLSLNAVSAGQIGNVGTTIEGVIGSATPSQPNITSVGTLTSLTTTGNITAQTANIYGGDIVANIASYSPVYYYANGLNILTPIINAAYSNTNAAAYLTTYTGNLLAGNITALNNITGYLNGPIGANGANSATFTTASITSTANSYAAGQGALQISGGFYAAGDSYIAGNLIVANLQATQQSILVVQEPLLYLESYGIGTYNYDIGFYGHFIGGNNNNYQHTGLVRNYVDNEWYLFSNAPEPSGNVVTFNSNTVYDTLKLGALLIQNTTSSGSTTSGALQVAGGAGIAGNLYAGSIQNTPIGSTTASTGAFTTLTTSSTIVSQGTITGAGQVVGYFNGAIGANTANTGAFTTVTATNNITAQTSNVYAGNLIGNISTYSSQYYWSNGVPLASTITGTYSNSNVASYLPTYSGNLSAGNVSISGNLNVTGNINNVLSNVYSQGGIFYGAPTTGFNALYAGQTGYTPLAQTLVQVSGNYNGFIQVNEQNTNNGSNASTDYIATADNGNQNDTYIDMGINSSGYVNATYGLQAANDGYLYVAGNTTTGGGNLVLSTTTVNDIIYSLGGIATANEFARMRANTNSFVISSTTNSTSTTTGALQVRGGAGVSGNVNVGSNLYVTGATFSGTTLNYVPQYSYFQHGGNINNYVQIVNQNLNGGNQATTDYVAVANNGSDSDTFIDFGINSSGYNQAAYNLTGPNDGYLYVAGNTTTGGGNLVISTYNLNDIVFSLAGSATGNEIARYRANTNSYVISSTTNSTSTTTGALQVRGGAGVSGNIYSGANIYATTAISAPTMLNSNIYPLSGSDLYKNTGANGNLWINYNGVVANVIVNGNTAANYGNLFIVNGATGQVGIKQPIGSFIGNASFQVNATDSMIIPVGTTSQRPSNAQGGMIRFNSLSNQLEFWNGTAWSGTGSTFTTVASYQFTGDGTTTTFTLGSGSTTNSTIVAINGVVQIPTTAYSVSGTSLTFTEAPLSTDIIDARVITTTATVTSISDSTGANAVVANSTAVYTTASNVVRYVANTSNYFSGGISAAMNPISLTQNTPTTIDSFSTSVYRVAKYVIKVSDSTNGVYCGAEVIVAHNGTTATSQVYGVVNTGSNSLATFSSTVSGGTLNITANTWSSTATATVFPTYMPI